jgi:multidrug efflux pump
MVIGAQWPGASPEEMTRQVTDRIEKKLEELEFARLYQERQP